MLILLPWANSQHGWHTVSCRHPPFLLPIVGHIHHCLGLCHSCQLAPLPSALPSPAPAREVWRVAIMLASYEQMARLCRTQVLVAGLTIPVWKEQLRVWGDKVSGAPVPGILLSCRFLRMTTRYVRMHEVLIILWRFRRQQPAGYEKQLLGVDSPVFLPQPSADGRKVEVTEG